jgi:hypothetical protein
MAGLVLGTALVAFSVGWTMGRSGSVPTRRAEPSRAENEVAELRAALFEAESKRQQLADELAAAKEPPFPPGWFAQTEILTYRDPFAH